MTPTGLRRKDIEAEGRKVLRLNGRQILLLANGNAIYAIANRCPHEGYPLSEGTDGPGVLTCNWHNWKFDLKSGDALIGRDPVRTYKLEERSGELFIDLTNPPPERLCAHALKGLDAALDDNDLARVAREVARLERAGFSVKTALVHAFTVRNDRLETGMGHAHAAAADWLTLATRAPNDATRLSASLEPLAHLAWDTEGSARFPFPEGVAVWQPRDFIAAVEAEDEPAAIALIRGALQENIPYAQLRPTLAEAALAHYQDFGHSVIYALKAGQLIDRLGEEAMEPTLLAYTRSVVLATREERLPEFRGYAAALNDWNGAGQTPASADDFIGLSISQCLQRLLQSSGRPTHELYDALLSAAAWNLLHFDTAVEAATDNAFADDVGWLDFTHALTFANACRHLCADRPDLWPKALLQLALFVGRNKKYVTDNVDAVAWHVSDPSAFIAREMNTLFDHGIVEPIIACHHTKVLFALEDELTHAPDAPWRDVMCAAVHRYLQTPMKRHHSLRIATQALDFVAQEG